MRRDGATYSIEKPPALCKDTPTIGNGRANAITCGKARDKTEHQKSKKKLRQVWIKIIHPHMTIQCRVGFMATRLPAHLFQSSFVEKSYALGQCRSHSNVRPTKNPRAFARGFPGHKLDKVTRARGPSSPRLRSRATGGQDADAFPPLELPTLLSASGAGRRTAHPSQLRSNSTGHRLWRSNAILTLLIACCPFCHRAMAGCLSQTRPFCLQGQPALFLQVMPPGLDRHRAQLPCAAVSTRPGL